MEELYYFRARVLKTLRFEIGSGGSKMLCLGCGRKFSGGKRDHGLDPYVSPYILEGPWDLASTSNWDYNPT